jgi:tetratricopeptide (TPR) repeat protein
MAPRLRSVLALMLPAVAFAALYLPSLDYEFVWTDAGEIEAGTLIRPVDGLLEAFVQPMHGNLDFRLAGVPQSFYRPLQVVLLSVVHDRHGAEPRWYRGLGLAFGAATAIAFTALAWTLFGRIAPALLAGTIFAVHPGGIEVYVWIAGLSAALADFFTVVSVLTAALALVAGGPGRRGALVSLSLVAFLLGLASKEHAVVTPALVLACALSLDVRDRGAGARRERARRATAAVLLLTQGIVAMAYVVWWRPHVLGGAFTGASLVGGSLQTHALTSLALWPRNLLWVFFPWQSTTSDVVRVVTSALDPMAWLGLLLAAGSAVAWLALLRRGQPVAALGLAWIWIAYLPTSGVVPLLHARAERNLCLSIFGAALLWPALGAPLLRALWPQAPRAVAAGLAAVVVLGLAERSHARIPDWRSDLALFGSDTARDPLYREGKYELAVALYEAGRSAEARAELEALLALGPAFAGHASYLRTSDVWEVYCIVNRSLGADADVVRFFDERFGGRTERADSLPGLFFCTAGALERVGRVAKALDIYTRLLQLGGERERVVFGVAIARCHAELGQYAEARRWLARSASPRLRDPAVAAEIRDVRRRIRRGTGPEPRPPP